MTFQEHFIEHWPEEAVGYVKNGEFFPLENIAADKLHTFEVAPAFLIEQPDVLLHSHCSGHEVQGRIDPRAPSKADLQGQVLTGVEWGICVTDGEVCEDPLYWGDPEHRPALLGREFIFNIQDCFTLLQDWYYQERKLKLPNLPRDPFWNETENLLQEKYEDWGFKKVPLNDLRRGDVLFYKVRSQFTNHLAIYLGRNEQGVDEVLSHWYGQISCIEPYTKWASFVQFTARYQA